MGSPATPRTEDCRHKHYTDGHCAEMICWNYSQSCPQHAYSGRTSDPCTRITRGVVAEPGTESIAYIVNETMYLAMENSTEPTFYVRTQDGTLAPVINAELVRDGAEYKMVLDLVRDGDECTFCGSRLTE